jgi:predicted RNA-binding Zn-ribbon protein involved in translation (DUF1610 family)
MAYIVDTFWCEACDQRFWEIVDREARPETFACPQCGELSVRVPSAPAVLNKSFYDGQRTDLKDMKEEGRLAVLELDTKNKKDKKLIRKERKQLLRGDK